MTGRRARSSGRGGSGRRGTGRVVELDALRGLAILGMLAVNVATPAVQAAAPQVAHAGWRGVRAADVVFPAFLLLVGAALAVGRAPSTGRLVRRVAILFGLGLALNLIDAGGISAGAIDQVRVMGVLQRIALAYAVAALVLRRDGPAVWAIGAAGLLAVHTALLLIPLGGASSLVPGGGVAAAVDRVVLGSAHTAGGVLPDPEGLLGTLGAGATVLLGALGGRLVRDARGGWLLLVAAAGSLAAGVGLAQVLPASKVLWTASFVLQTAGWTAAVLAGLVALRPVGGERLLAGPAALGRNALAVYVATEAVRRVARRPGADGTSPLADLAGVLADLTGSAVAGGWLLIGCAVAVAAFVAALLAWRGITLRA